MSDAPNAPELHIPKPGPEHEVFRKDVGTWDAAVEVRFAPGQPPQVSKGQATRRLACGGLWLITEFMNETTGFEGHGVFGYDPARKKYVGTWVDPMRTFMATSEGTWDAAAKTMTMWTEATGPHGKPMRWREVTEARNADTQVWRSFMSLPDGGEAEVMTVTYRRRK